MPTVFDANYLRPNSDDEFEEMIRDICEIEWGDPDTARFGRKGQKQYGVDIYGRPIKEGEYFAAQCKLRSTDKQLSEDEIEWEVKEAKNFPSVMGSLKKLIIATDAPRDTHTQGIVGKISNRETQNGGFEVAIWFWSDITRRIATQKRLLIKYYRSFLTSLTNINYDESLFDKPLSVSVFRIGRFSSEGKFDTYLNLRGIQTINLDSSERVNGLIIIYNSEGEESEVVR